LNYKVIADKGLNVRSGPGTNWEVIATANAGDVLISPAVEGWLPIELTDETIGWCSSKYLTEDKEAPVVPAPAPDALTGKAVVAKAMTQAGDPYIFGTEVDLNDPNPDGFDCSELLQWVCAQLKVMPKMPDGASAQLDHCIAHNTTITVAEGVKIAGALLFRISPTGNHVVISRGDGSTIEAKGSAYGVGVFSTAGRGWTHAAKIPGVTYA